MCIKLLLVTDLDNTLVGNPRATATLNKQLQAIRQDMCLVYATGRSYSSGCNLMATENLLVPDYWIAAVGTEIYHGTTQDRTWAQYLSQNWARESIVAITQHFPALRPQTAGEQNEWKISFWLDPKAPRSIIQELRDRIAANNLAAQVIFSGDRDVDILPINSNKGNALRYLQTQLQVSPDLTLVCGDSGNDISLFAQQTRGVLVGNALPELLEWYHQYGNEQHYLAKAYYADGIQEALEHFGFLSQGKFATSQG